MMLVEL